MKLAQHSTWKRPGWYAWLTAAGVLLGIIVFLYPQTASWFSQYQQSQLITGFSSTSNPTIASKNLQDLAQAYEYNTLLSSGAVLHANTNKPSSGGVGTENLDYNKLLSGQSSGLMARIQIPSIDVDLPVYHGTSDSTLLKGAGHLEGSSLPIGGVGTRSVITAHRGLANATMFSDLDRVSIGDTFTVRVLDEVLTYQVTDTTVISPDDTEMLFADPERDLLTLITCTPLGINSHRIVVTGERVTPTPIKDVQAATTAPKIPGFPMWALYLGGSLVALTGFLFLVGRADAKSEKISREREAQQRAGLHAQQPVVNSVRRPHNDAQNVQHHRSDTATVIRSAMEDSSQWMPPQVGIQTYKHVSMVPPSERLLAKN